MNFLLIGKPNAGKSSIFNILSSGKNIIHKEEGTTRDWHKDKVHNTRNIVIYDTPGIIIHNNKINKVQFSSLFKIIDKFIYVIDYRDKNFEIEIESINKLRSFNKEIILIINKDDNYAQNINIKQFGIDAQFFISCAHRIGFEELFEYLNRYDEDSEETILENQFSVAIFGKPNAGKSTLANSFLGFERIKTSSKAETTSDFVEDN